MVSKSKPSKWTPSQIRKHIQGIRIATEKHRQESKSEHFEAITPEEIEKKLRRVNSPMFVSQGWNNTTQGGTVNYSLSIYNPDPVPVSGFLVHFWVGSGNVDPTVGTFLLNVDTRFPRLTSPSFPSITIAPGASATLNFALKVPATVEKTSYFGNSCLLYRGAFDVGTYLDRACIVFGVS